MRKIFSIPFWLLLTTVVSAEIIFFGIALANVTAYHEIDYGVLAVNEHKELVIATVHEPINTSVNFTTNCEFGSDILSTDIQLPIGSSKSGWIDLNLNGVTEINEDDGTIETGNITMRVVPGQEGEWNCSLYFNVSEFVNITYR